MIDLITDTYNKELRELIQKFSQQLPISNIYYVTKDVLSELNSINKQVIEEQQKQQNQEEKKDDGC